MRPLHLLVTDDDPDKRYFLTRGLRREFPHASIFECHSGREALDYIRANPIDAVITNHNMAPVSGIEMIAVLRSEGVAIPIIMCSGHEELRSAAEAAGVDLFLDTHDMMGIGGPIGDYLRSRGLGDRTEFSGANDPPAQ